MPHCTSGETLLLHCDYDATSMSTATFIGADERTHEMCDQYIVSTVGLSIGCSRETMGPDKAGEAPLPDKAANPSFVLQRKKLPSQI